jgi:hypothetical protein
MYCAYCYAHHKKKKPCLGCRLSDEGKPEHCRKCIAKDCAKEKGVLFCYDCSDYPCVLIKRLDKSYRTRYNESLIGYMKVINEKGMDFYLRFEKERLKCPECRKIFEVSELK